MRIPSPCALKPQSWLKLARRLMAASATMPPRRTIVYGLLIEKGGKSTRPRLPQALAGGWQPKPASGPCRDARRALRRKPEARDE